MASAIVIVWLAELILFVARVKPMNSPVQSNQPIIQFIFFLNQILAVLQDRARATSHVSAAPNHGVAHGEETVNPGVVSG
jgi:hypothetical protein